MNTPELLAAARKTLATSAGVRPSAEGLVVIDLWARLAIPTVGHALDLLEAVLRGREPHEYEGHPQAAICRRCGLTMRHPVHSDAAAAYVAALRKAVE